MHRSRSATRFAILAAVTLGLAACTSPTIPGGQAEPAPGANSGTDSAAQSGQQNEPEFHPGGTADQNLAYFTATLSEFVDGGGEVLGQPIVDRLAAAGFDKAEMQVSFDMTKTDLLADAIYVSVRIEADCLLGQVMTGDRSVTTEAVAAVGPEKNLCLIGNTRPIDW